MMCFDLQSTFVHEEGRHDLFEVDDRVVDFQVLLHDRVVGHRNRLPVNKRKMHTVIFARAG